MKPHAAWVLSVLHPAPEPTPSPAESPRDPVTGRFIAPPGVTLGGGYQAPPPPARKTAEEAAAEHNAFLAELVGPTDLGA